MSSLLLPLRGLWRSYAKPADPPQAPGRSQESASAHHLQRHAIARGGPSCFQPLESKTAISRSGRAISVARPQKVQSICTPTASLLAVSVVSALLLATTFPTMAAEQQDLWLRQGALRDAWTNHTAKNVHVSASAALQSAAVGAPILGPANDPASWRTKEFGADWGLAAIGADHAYARGLTATGIRLGVFDSGTGLDHPEFAGKNHRSIRLADVLADGSLCGKEVLSGPDACFRSDGDQVAIDYVLLDPKYKYLLNRANYFAGASYNLHGTHVAGTVAANRDGNGMHGVAFGADLSIARLFASSVRYLTIVQEDGELTLDPAPIGALGASDSIFPQLYAQLNEQQVRAVNHSWGLREVLDTAENLDLRLSDPGYADGLEAIAEGSRARGLIQVWAAGNTSQANPSPQQAPIAGMYASMPRAFTDIEPYWLAVVNLTPALELSAGSMRCGLAANWCLAAPGTNIDSTMYGDDSALDVSLDLDANGNLSLDVNEHLPTYSYALNSGTSMAAPHVTGALGLLFERFPYLDSAQVRDVLLTTARDVGAPGIDEVYGWGLVDLKKAVDGYGSLRVDTDVVMNQRAGGLKVWDGGAWDDWSNDIGGPGKLTKSGVGWLRLSGDNAFNGAVVREGTLELDGVNTLASAVEVHGGQLLVNGSLVSTTLTTTGGVSTVGASGVLKNSDLFVNGGVLSFNGTQSGGTTTVGASGLLKGIGTLGSTRVDGTFAPGNAMETFTINGDYVQGASGTFAAELSPGNRGDLVRVSGTATLGGTLVAVPQSGAYYLGEQFNILRADGGVSGRFANADFSMFSPFLHFSLAYAADGARIDVARGALLATAASTPNQRSVAASADGLAIDQGLPRPLTQLFPQQVGDVLDELSGELHAATALALVEGSRHVRDAALSRRIDSIAPGAEAGRDTVAWAQAIGGNGRLDGNGNTARTDANSSALLVGVDRQFGDWQIGALIGAGRTDVEQQDRRAGSKIDSTHFGAYASRNWDRFGLRGGVAVSRNEVKSTRDVAFAGFSDNLSARYDAPTRQAFIEAGYRFGGAEGRLEPYLQVARVEVELKQIDERGGAAALHGRVDDTATTIATAGIRFEKGLKASFQENSWLHLRGGVGYRRASGDRSQVANLAFANSSGSFAVDGAPIAENAVVAEMGLSAWLTPRHRLELGYSGQFGSESREHGASLQWSVRF